MVLDINKNLHLQKRVWIRAGTCFGKPQGALFLSGADSQRGQKRADLFSPWCLSSPSALGALLWSELCSSKILLLKPCLPLGL